MKRVHGEEDALDEVKRVKRSGHHIELPADIWIYLAEWVPDPYVLFALSLCTKYLYSARAKWNLLRWATTRVDQWTIELYEGRKMTHWAVLMHQCQLCPRKLHQGRPNLWQVWAHEECVSRHVIHMFDCVKKYDLVMQQVEDECGPMRNHSVWLYRVEQLVKRLYGQSLEQRASDVARERARRQESARQDMEHRAELMMEWSVRKAADASNALRNMTKVRGVKLEALMEQYQVPPLFRMWLRQLYYESKLMPMNWVKLEQNVLCEIQSMWEEWVASGLDVSLYESLVRNKEWMFRHGHLILRPEQLRNKMRVVGQWLNHSRANESDSSEVLRYVQAFDQTL